jgi:hypothetical protein
MNRDTSNVATTPDISQPLRRTSPLAFRVIGLIYLTSFVLPVDSTMFGLGAFVYGGYYTIMLVGLPVTFPWLANPIFWFGMTYLRKGHLVGARVCGVLASILAAAFCVLAISRNAHLGIGYWMWLACMVSLALATAPMPDRQTWLEKAETYEDFDNKFDQRREISDANIFVPKRRMGLDEVRHQLDAFRVVDDFESDAA